MIALTTYFSLVVGELVPKQVALRSAVPIAMLAAKPMAFVARIAAPLVWLLDTSFKADDAIWAVPPQYIPANPTLELTDVEAMSKLAHRRDAFCAVDNTLLGPLYQQPLALGADLVLYSATKYLGGHSDVVAGVALGSAELITRLKGLRTILGNMLEPYSAWLMLRSLETAKLRMTCSRKNAQRIVDWLSDHPKVARVYFPGFEAEGRQAEIYQRQCSGPGALLSFELRDGDEAAAFRFLNAVRLIELAVSLGANESLVEHPATMTHSDVPAEEQLEIGITPGLVRLAVGIEMTAKVYMSERKAAQFRERLLKLQSSK